MANVLSTRDEPLDPESHYVLVALMNNQLLDPDAGLSAMRIAEILGPKCNRDLLPVALVSLIDQGIITQCSSKQYALAADPEAIDAYLYRCDGRLKNRCMVGDAPEWF